MLYNKSNTLKRPFYNRKGLTFKGATVIVIGMHIVGFCSLYGYSKYKSNQARIARAELKAKLEQRESNDWVDNNSNNNNAKLRVVAKPSPQPRWSNENQISTNQANKTPKDTNTSNLIAKINHATKVAGDNINKVNDEIKVFSKSVESHITKQKRSTQQIVADKSEKQKEHTSNQTVSSIEQTRYERLAKALEYDKKKKAYLASRRTHEDLSKVNSTTSPKISSEPTRSTVPKLVAKADRQMNTITTRLVDDKLRRDIEFDEVTQEVVQTFYSY